LVFSVGDVLALVFIFLRVLRGQCSFYRFQMNQDKQIRWKQRFESFEKSFHLLERTMSIAEPSEAERGGLIQFYEMAFELA